MTANKLEPAVPKPGQISRCQACAVRSLSVCAVLDNRELEQLAAITTSLQYSPRETLFYEGDTADNVFNVTAGAIKLYKLLPDGRRQITGFVFPGDFLGIAFHNRYAYTAEAITGGTVCRFPRHKLETLLSELPALERRLLETASNELAAAQDQMLLLGRKSAQERLATFLLSVSRRAQRHGRNTTMLELPMSRSDIGDYLGLTIETISRAFTKLRKADYIALPDTHHVELRDMTALAAMSGLETDEEYASSALAVGY